MTGEADDAEHAARPPAWVTRVGRTSWAFLGFAGAFAVVLYVLGSLRDVVIPLVVAAFLAVVFSPIVDWLAARRVPRAIGAMVVILLIFAVFAATLGIVVIGVIDRADELTEAFDDARDRITEAVADWNLDGLVDRIRDQADDSGGFIRDGLGQQIGSVLGSAVGFVTGLVLGVVLLYYLLKDGGALVHAAVARRRPAGVAQSKRIATQAAESIRGYFKGRTVLALVQGVAVSIALWILDVPLAGSVGVVNFIGAYIPYFGAFVGGAFAVLMGLAGGGAGLALLALVVVLFVNLVLENLLEPKLVGSTLRLHPVVVLVSTVAGGLLLGIVGLILASPTVAITLNLARELRESGFFSSPRRAVSAGHDDASDDKADDQADHAAAVEANGSETEPEPDTPG